MRQHIDLGVLDLKPHRDWLDGFLKRMTPTLDKVRIHWIKWDRGVETSAADVTMYQASAPPRTDLFLQAQVQLRRFDALLFPVSLVTLGWTRQTLACAPRGPLIPVFGVLDDLRSGAILDLIELGMTDFVTTHSCPQAFRARLISAVSRAPKLLSLREPQTPLDRVRRPPANGSEVGINAWSLKEEVSSLVLKSVKPSGDPTSRCAGCYIKVSSLGWPDQGFGPSKKRIVALFEKQYLQAALKRADGNITAAATNSLKNRRSFWELLRKHGLVSGRWSMTEENESSLMNPVPRVKFDTKHKAGINSDLSEP